jgi:hypothetical protein
MAIGLGIGEASALKAKRRDDIVPGTQLVVAPTSGGLNPQKLLARCLRNGSHEPSLKDKLPR